jgi:hypothetical protein
LKNISILGKNENFGIKNGNNSKIPTLKTAVYHFHSRSHPIYSTQPSIPLLIFVQFFLRVFSGKSFKNIFKVTGASGKMLFFSFLFFRS